MMTLLARMAWVGVESDRTSTVTVFEMRMSTREARVT